MTEARSKRLGPTDAVLCAGAGVRPRAVRRRLLAAAGTVLGARCLPVAGTTRASIARSLSVPVPLARLHVDDTGTLFGVSASGELWQRGAADWARRGAGLDASAPIAGGHRRLVGRSRDGGMWLLEAGAFSQHGGVALAPHAGLLVLALGVVGVAPGSDGRHHLIRLEQDGIRWTQTARSTDAVLPDARPVQFDPAGAGSDEDGHVAVYGGPDRTRYRHAVLGDDIEATSLMLLERHDLRAISRLELAPPFVFEDIAPRPVAWGRGRALVTVRSGPEGAQVALVAQAEGDPTRFTLAALGAPIGIPNRWLSPSTDGTRVWAVHTPHLGGIVHRYRLDAGRLGADAIARGVTNHVLGARELDLSAWVGRAWIVPTQDRRALRIFEDTGQQGDTLRYRDVALAAPAVALARWRHEGVPGVAVLMQDGSAAWVG